MNYVELYKLIETLDKNKDGEINYRWEKCSSVLQGTHLPSNLAFCEKCYYRVLFGAIRYLFTFQPGVMIEMFVYSTLWCYKVPIYLPTWFWENCLYKYSLVLQGTYLLYNLVLREMLAYSTLWCYKYLFTFQPGVLREMFL